MVVDLFTCMYRNLMIRYIPLNEKYNIYANIIFGLVLFSIVFWSYIYQLTLNIKQKCYQKRQLKTILELHLLHLFGNGFHYQYIKVDCLKSLVIWCVSSLAKVEIVALLSPVLLRSVATFFSKELRKLTV